MFFDRIADFIGKHAKAIILVWIVVLLCSIWPAAHATEVLDYSTTGMAGSSAESVEGSAIVSEYFYDSGTDIDSLQLLLIKYDSGADDTAAKLSASINTALKTYVDGSGTRKIISDTLYGSFVNDDGSGVLVYALAYNPEYTGSIYKDTGSLRNLVADQKAALDDATGITTYVTGSSAISYDMETDSTADVARIDPFSVLLVLVLVGLFFRSLVSSAMPPLTIGAAFGTVLCLLFFIGQLINIFYITEMLILVTMLGAGCDYCIFILARYREERRGGADHNTALHRAVVWAGESITTSGLAVMIGFGSMSICSFEMLSTMGIILALGIAMALLAALTLMSSILALVGDRLFWPSSDPHGGYTQHGWFKKVGDLGRRYFAHSAAFSIKHAKAIVVAAIMFTVPMAYVYATSESSYDMVSALSNGEAAQGLDVIEDYTYGGLIMPNYAVIETSAAFGTVTTLNPIYTGPAGSDIKMTVGSLAWTDSQTLTSLNELSAQIQASDKENLGTVSSLVPWAQIEKMAMSKGATTEDEVVAYFAAEFGGMAGNSVTGYTENLLKPMAFFIQQNCWSDYAYELGNARLATVYDWVLYYLMDGVGGVSTDTTVTGASGTAVQGTVTTLTYAQITAVTVEQGMSDRSIATVGHITDAVDTFAAANPGLVVSTWITGSPAAMYEISEQVNQEFIKVEILAVALIVILLFFVMASYLTPLRSVLTILMSVVWTVAVTHLLFTHVLGYGVMWMIPIILLVICLGLGMDYDILLTTRIKENHLHRGMDNDTAIREALSKSGAIITICGLIMGGAFGTLMLSSTQMLQQFGFALMFAILVDALIVRTYIVPAVMHLLGDWNWKGPKFLHRHDAADRAAADEEKNE